MFEKRLSLKAYTLLEIILVIVIITVVFAVTIGVTKRKLESSISYSYYSAYASLKDVSRALLNDFNPQNDNYKALNPFEHTSKLLEHIPHLFEQPTYADVTTPFCNIGDNPPACGKICNDGLWQDIAGYSKDCTPDTEEWRDLPDCKCVPVARTIPQKGEKFCKLFEQRVNTNSGDCTGSDINSSSDNFNNKKPDLVLRNGIRIYNLHTDPKEIDELSGNKSGFTVLNGMSSLIFDTGEYGYTVYVDIDGEKGSSTLWEDVYPFYITLSGQVVPVYNTVDGNNLGGNSSDYLQTSIQYEKINAQGRRTISWLAKSVSYKEGACGSGYINSSTPYCSGVAEKSECSSTATGSKCTLKTVKPIKFF